MLDKVMKVDPSCHFCGGQMTQVDTNPKMQIFVNYNSDTDEKRAYDILECNRCPYTILWRIELPDAK